MNNNSGNITIKGRIKSIGHAIDGIVELIKGQHNAQIHLVATISIVILGLIVNINKTEWLFLIIAVILVWVSEALNTAIEFLCDITSSDFHPMIKKSKDVAAGAVLLSSIGAVVIGLIIFFPYILSNV